MIKLLNKIFNTFGYRLQRIRQTKDKTLKLKLLYKEIQSIANEVLKEQEIELHYYTSLRIKIQEDILNTSDTYMYLSTNKLIEKGYNHIDLLTYKDLYNITKKK